MEKQSSFERWENYPLGLDGYSPLDASWSCQLQQLAKHSKEIFSDSRSLEVRIVRKLGMLSIYQTNIAKRSIAKKDNRMDPVLVLHDEEQLDESLKETGKDSFRIVSFFQEFSLTTLKCSRSAMMNTLSECEVKPMFLDVVLKFGDQEAIFEESSGFRETYQQANGSFGE